ncbi:Box C/D snoRNA accumulation [Sporothrix epigloea]|uniref:Box C/D snoRNA accumulation n=1 Tax=Sporothrix epigloea TaxID=1892477 RepID=A0ABP0D9K0_9PEZI
MDAALSDPVLTTLCSVCRTNPPRYKCPRCNLPYCSVPCNRRHRARTGCSGIRDVTVFVPRNRLCTSAGIDRDYNFLQGIDVARASAVKHVVDERRVLRANDVQARVLGEQEEQPAGNITRSDKRQWQKGPKGSKKDLAPALVRLWQGEELVFAPARRASNQAGQDIADSGSSSSSFCSFRVRGLCRRDSIELLGTPRGFARQRENNTTVATTTTATPGGGKVSEVHLFWQVEWFLYAGAESVNGQPEKDAKPTRILRRVLDNIPLYKAHAALLTADPKATNTLVNEAIDESVLQKKQSQKQQQQQQQPPKRRQRTPTAPFANAFFFFDSIQDETGVWRIAASADVAGDSEEDEAACVVRDQYAYYLLRPRVSGVVHHAQAKELIPIDVADTLATALSGRSVLEFPTIYVLPKTKMHTQILPKGHVLGSTERRVFETTSEAAHENNGRPATSPGKRARTGRDIRAPPTKKHKGECGDNNVGNEDADSDAAAAGLDSETSSSGEDSSEEDSDDEDELDGQGSDQDEEEDDGEDDGRLNGLPAFPLGGLSSGSSPAGGKHRLVVYDSWSEKSDE